RVRLHALATANYLTVPAIRQPEGGAYALADEKRPRGRPAHIWALGQAGATVLRLPGDWNRNNGRLRPSAFAHPLMVTHVRLTLERALRAGLIDLEYFHGENAWRTEVDLDAGRRAAVVPDASMLLVDRRTDREAMVFL